ncbi:MAG: hypothetical protein HRU38_14020 [Saccharospirillaceae bacterium]|nr:hypothetical protein [Saccharospirillaceae bacterium]
MVSKFNILLLSMILILILSISLVLILLNGIKQKQEAYWIGLNTGQAQVIRVLGSNNIDGNSNDQAIDNLICSATEKYSELYEVYKEDDYYWYMADDLYGAIEVSNEFIKINNIGSCLEYSNLKYKNSQLAMPNKTN